MVDSDATRQARTDACYEVSHALKDLALVIGRDLLPRPLAVTPPHDRYLLEVQVNAEDVEAWLFSLIDPPPPIPLQGFGGRIRHCTAKLDATDTMVRLVWIEAS